MAGKKLNRRKADVPATASLFQGRPIRLLLVDDDAADLRMMREIIGQIHRPQVEMVEARTVEAALNIMDSSDVDLCMCDFRLSRNTNALDLFHASRAHTHAIPFIGITGVMDEETTANTLLIAGFDDVLLKSDLIRANVYRILRNAWLRNAHTRQLIQHSTIDDLTGILNRRGVMLRLELEHARALRSQQPLAIIFADLNGFKNINDEFGHVEGDKALIHVARLLEAQVRRTDIVGRMGGDEFVIAMPGASAPIAERMAERIKAAAQSAPVQLNTQSVTLQLSAGVAISNPAQGAISLNELVKQADESMYRTKHRRRKYGWRPTKDS
jgi:diguanylate cyclase (GGDEF)-like protein